MSISLLQELSEVKLPVTITGGDSVDAVHILALAGHIEAQIAKAVRTPTGWMNPTATVLSVTKHGRRMLRKFPRQSGLRKWLGQGS